MRRWRSATRWGRMVTKNINKTVRYLNKCTSYQFVTLLMYNIFSRASPAANSNNSSSSSWTYEARVSVAVRSACVGLTLQPVAHVLDFAVYFLVPHYYSFQAEKIYNLTCVHQSSCRCHHYYYCSTTSTAQLFSPSLISRRVGLTTTPAVSLGGMARTLQLWTGTVCLRVLAE